MLVSIQHFAITHGDGHLDFYLLTFRYLRKGGRPREKLYGVSEGKPYVLPEYQKYYGLKKFGQKRYGTYPIGRPDRLFRNKGDGTFEDVTETAGIKGNDHGLSVTWWDFNHDGLSDIYVANDFDDPDHLYRNNGDGTFTDVTKETVPHTTWSSMGADSADINNDGLPDLFCVDMSGTSHYKQKTTMGVMNAERILGVAGPTAADHAKRVVAEYRHGTVLRSGILGRDGLIPIGVGPQNWPTSTTTAGSMSSSPMACPATPITPTWVFDPTRLVGRTEWDLYENTPTRPEQNLAFRNTGDLKFQDVSKRWNLDPRGNELWGGLQ